MIKNLLLIAPFTLCMLFAQEIALTPEQSANWQIKTTRPQHAALLPLGEYVAEVHTPPSLMRTISLPFEAKIQTVYASNHQRVHCDGVLALVTGTPWIEAQQKAIADAIEFEHHKHLAHRKTLLCKEEIIPKKECVAANAELKADTIKLMASKALLKSYGADDTVINTLFKTFKMQENLEVKSPVKGSVIRANATPGQTIAMSEALFLIQQSGALWLESAIEADKSHALKAGDAVQIQLGSHRVETSILDIASVINPHNQTRSIRFVLPQEHGIVSGLRTTVQLFLKQPALKITKESLTKENEKTIVFVQTKQGFRSVAVEVLAEDATHYYLKPSPGLESPIATTSVAALKNLLGSDDE